MAFKDWSGGLFDAVGSIGSSMLGSNQPQVQPQTIIIPEEKNNNTALYIGGGILLIVIIILVIYLMNKNKGKN